MRKIIPIILATVIIVLCGCAMSLKDANDYYHDYYLKVPIVKKFTYEMKSPDGSIIKGRIVYDITEVKWPKENQTKYSFAGKKTHEFNVELKTKQSAITWASQEMIEKNLDPTDVDKVFRKLSQEELRKLGLPESIKATKMDRSKIKNIILPIIYNDNDTESFKSEITENAMDCATEIATVWLKGMSELRLVMVSGYSVYPLEVKKIGNSDNYLELLLLVRTHNGEELGKCICRFRKHTSLSYIEFKYSNGDIVTFTE